MSDPYRFTGFDSPNYTQVPDKLFDELAPNLTEAELRVVLYVIRRTFGFKKTADAVSVSQMVKGITTRDGRVLDQGTGMSRSAVQRGVAGLVEKGVIQKQQLQSENGEYETNVYTLVLTASDEGVALQKGHPSPFAGPPVALQKGLQETEQETDNKRELSNFSKRQMTIAELEEAEKRHQDLERWTHPERFKNKPNR